LQLESYRSATGPLELCVPVFPSLVAGVTAARQKVLAQYGPELASGWYFVDSTHVKVHADGANPAGGKAPQASGGAST